jgi:hypothetical protein
MHLYRDRSSLTFRSLHARHRHFRTVNPWLRLIDRLGRLHGGSDIRVPPFSAAQHAYPVTTLLLPPELIANTIDQHSLTFLT